MFTMHCGLNVIILVTLSLIFGNFYVQATNSSDEHSRISYGTFVAGNRYPYMVSLQLQTTWPPYLHFCGGVLIHPKVVLSAAHCFIGGPGYKMFFALPNYHNMRIPQSGDKYYAVITRTDHPNFVAGKFENDISILGLRESVPTQFTISPIALPTIQAQPGINLMVAGFGDSEKGEDSWRLREAEQTRLDDSRCFKDWPDVFKPQIMICTSNEKAHADACEGDSGGPLVIKEPDGRDDTLVGLVSYGKCAPKPKGFRSKKQLDHRSGLYTNVLRYVDWINKTMSTMGLMI